ncbi:MAG TPA: hypothetical protein VJ951_14460, partial [Bacteroidales bacterium]|nr:hypothetical protein [Bacteroidales bacterium]
MRRLIYFLAVMFIFMISCSEDLGLENITNDGNDDLHDVRGIFQSAYYDVVNDLNDSAVVQFQYSVPSSEYVFKKLLCEEVHDPQGDLEKEFVFELIMENQIKNNDDTTGTIHWAFFPRKKGIYGITLINPVN